MVSSLIVALATAAAATEDWSRSFEPARVAQYLPAAEARVAVVSVDSGANPAASALAEAFRSTGLTTLVMDGSPLGDVTALDDRAILARAKNQPVTLIVIVRTSPRGRVAVRGFDAVSGRSEFAFTATAGHRIAPGPHQRTVVAARATVADGSRAARLLEDPAEENDYALRELAVVLPMARGEGGRIHTGPAYAARGRHLNRIEWDVFFDAAGRSDLAQRYRSAANTKLTLQLGGAAIAFTGIAVGIALTFSVPGIAPLVLGCNLAGLAMIATALLIDPMPVSAEEAYAMAKAHNEALWAKTISAVPVPAPGSRLAWAIGPLGASAAIRFDLGRTQ